MKGFLQALDILKDNLVYPIKSSIQKPLDYSDGFREMKPLALAVLTHQENQS